MKGVSSIEQRKCGICAKDYDTGTVLLDMRLKETLEMTTGVGWGICPDCEKFYSEGYIALVGCDDAKSEKRANGNVDPDKAWRTGNVVRVRFEVFERIFNMLAAKDGKPYRFMFVDDEVIRFLEKRAAEGEAQ